MIDKVHCCRCKQLFERKQIVWVPYIEQKVTGSIPYCIQCYQLLEGILKDKIQVNR
jgi:NAD-dependent SIR2 family protein deacetylase